MSTKQSASPCTLRLVPNETISMTCHSSWIGEYGTVTAQSFGTELPRHGDILSHISNISRIPVRNWYSPQKNTKRWLTCCIFIVNYGSTLKNKKWNEGRNLVTWQVSRAIDRNRLTNHRWRLLTWQEILFVRNSRSMGDQKRRFTRIVEVPEGTTVQARNYANVGRVWSIVQVCKWYIASRRRHRLANSSGQTDCRNGKWRSEYVDQLWRWYAV